MQPNPAKVRSWGKGKPSTASEDDFEVEPLAKTNDCDHAHLTLVRGRDGIRTYACDGCAITVGILPTEWGSSP